MFFDTNMPQSPNFKENDDAPPMKVARVDTLANTEANADANAPANTPSNAEIISKEDFNESFRLVQEVFRVEMQKLVTQVIEQFDGRTQGLLDRIRLTEYNLGLAQADLSVLKSELNEMKVVPAPTEPPLLIFHPIINEPNGVEAGLPLF